MRVELGVALPEGDQRGNGGLDQRFQETDSGQRLTRALLAQGQAGSSPNLSHAAAAAGGQLPR